MLACSRSIVKERNKIKCNTRRFIWPRVGFLCDLAQTSGSFYRLIESTEWKSYFSHLIFYAYLADNSETILALCMGRTVRKIGFHLPSVYPFKYRQLVDRDRQGCQNLPFLMTILLRDVKSLNYSLQRNCFH